MMFSCDSSDDNSRDRLGEWPAVKEGQPNIYVEDIKSDKEASLAPTTENLLECTPNENGMESCTFKNNIVADAQESLSLFKGRYTYDCTGDYVYLSISSENAGVPMTRFVEGQEFSIYGYGPLQILQHGPTKLDNANLLAGACSIKVEITEISPAN